MATGSDQAGLLRLLPPVAGVAWLLLALSDRGVVLPDLCLAGFAVGLPSADQYVATLALVPLSMVSANWAAMIVAMMVPLLFVPLLQVRSMSLKRMRPFVMGFFAAGYLAVWIIAGSAFLGLAVTIHIASRDGRGGILMALAVAAIWQMSPWKQAALNRCHGRRALAAFGPAAYRDALVAGLAHGGWCLLSCWALMLVALVAPTFHFAAMLCVSLYIWAERLEHPRPPRWTLGVPMRGLRALAWRLRNERVGAHATGMWPNRQ